MTSFWKSKRWESKKWREAAKGQDCTMNLPCCNHNTETTVLAHRNGAGMGMRSPDHDAVDACARCHDAIDGRGPSGLAYPDTIQLAERFETARLKTIINRLERGIMK
jgi:cytochrome c553